MSSTASRASVVARRADVEKGGGWGILTGIAGIAPVIAAILSDHDATWDQLFALSPPQVPA